MTFDLSNAQKMILFSNIDNPSNDSFYINFRMDYDIEDLESLKYAINVISAKSFNLRIKYDSAGDFKQYYVDDDDGGDKFEYVEYSGDMGDIYDFIKELLADPFDSLFDSPLYRLNIIKCDDCVIFAGVAHHTLVDGTSLFAILPQEIEKAMDAFRNGEEYEPTNDLSYEIYVNREKEFLLSDESDKEKEYWLNHLSNYTGDWYAFDDNDMKSYNLVLDKDLTDNLRYLANVDGIRISPFVLALSAVHLYLSKAKNCRDIVWNTSVNGRYYGEDLLDKMGMFVNTLPLRINPDKDLSFKEFLLYSKKILKDGLSHGKLQFNNYTSDLRTNGIEPALITMFSIVSNSTDFGAELLIYPTESEFPFHIRVNKDLSDKNGLQSLLFEYNMNCFSNKQIIEIANGIKDLLEDIAENSDKLCSEYEIKPSEFFEAENYFNNLIKSFDAPTIISPDVNDKSKPSDFKLLSYSFSKNISKESILSTILFNLTKFSFSKDILISALFNRELNGNEYSLNKNKDSLNKYNELAIGYKFDTNKSVAEYIDEINKHFKEVQNFAFYPLINNQNIEFESEILFNWDNAKVDLSKYKLVLSTVEKDSEIILNIEYDSSYYSDELIDAFLNAILVLMNKFEDSSLLLKDISIKDTVDNDEDFEINLENEGIIKDIFERWVRDEPDKVILTAEDGDFTYAELNEKANRIANGLIKRGVEIEDKVMFMMKRNSDLIATVIAINKAGCAFIPIDPKYPKERINQVLEDSNSKFVIISDDIDYDGENAINVSELLKEEDISNPNIELSPDNLSFLIYTSGSTGKPKGVMITHRGITNYIANHPLNMPIYSLVNNCNKMISISTVSFIVFLREIFGTIMNGLPVVFANDEESINPLELAKLFDKTGADAFGSTPTRLLEYLKLEEIQDKVAKCKFMIVGGEGFPPRLYDVIREYSDCEIYNSYGPTEVTIASHGKLIDSPLVTAGFPMLNVVDKIMDIDGNELPPYVTGELYVGGAGIARGYSNNEELTNKVFMKINGINYYNTGDLAKKDEFDEVYVLGRNDTQIKLRGLRIELSEIEDTIAKYPGINAIKVMVKKINNVEHLCAYYTVNDSVNQKDLKDYLISQIPEYMVPSYYMELDKFPTTPNGKTDFKNLPEIEVSSEDLVAPDSETEKILYDIISDILETEEFGTTTDLFSVGLTSLSVIKLISAISKEFDVVLSINKILKIKTIKEIANEIDSNNVYVDLDSDSNDSYLNKNIGDGKLYPLTANQLGVYFDCLKDSEKLAYNLPKFINFGNIDADRLKLAIIKLIDYHSYLKTRIVMNNGIAYQEERNSLVVDDLVEIVDVNFDSLDLNNDDLKVYVGEFIKPFNLSEGPLFRFRIIKSENKSNEVALLADFHHIIVDGTSLNIFFRQLALIYDDFNLDLNELNNVETLNGFEYSLKEVKIEESNLYKEAELFYYNKIKEFDEGTLVSPDLSGLEEDGVEEEALRFIGKSEIDELCNKLSISPNNLFLGISSFVLSKFVYNRDLLFATITNGRFNPEEQNTLAMMVKTLPIAMKLDSDLSFKDYFEYVNKEWLDTLSYSCYPLTKIADKYGIIPEFLYAFHGKIIEDISMDGRIIERESLDYDGLKFKLSLNIIEEDDYKLSCKYNNELYSKELINTFLDSIAIVLAKLSKLSAEEISKTLLKDLSIVSYDMIDKFELKDIPEDRLNKLFEKVVSEHADDIALICDDGEFTYAELNEKANRIANGLIKRGVGVEDRVMFVLRRNSNVFASIFGISKSGAGFIPIDPDYPKDRIEHVLTDSESKFIIVDDIIDINNVDLSEYSDRLLNIDDLLAEEDISNPNPDVSGENLAYIIYTSGSTGLPKGVMIEHRNITNFVYPDPSSIYCYEIATNTKNKDYKCLSIATVAFDMLMQETFIPLLNGGCVVFANDKQYKDPLALYELIKASGANVYNGTPSRLLQYFEMDGLKDAMAKFKIFCVGGEGIPQQLYDKVKNESDGIFYNIYGPTETTVVCNTRLVEDGVLAIGKPLFNIHEEIMDMDSNPLPPHVIGELYIAGGGVSRAYLNRPEKNAEAYMDINGIKFYRAGDFAKWNDKGEVFILGRLDNQIKLRGLRIEIGEIESAISAYPGIKSLIVLVKKIKDNDHLCAYFTVDEEYKKDNLGEGEFSIDIADLKATISEKLTYYMVPTVYMELDEMPQTLNGKTDIKNLPEPVLITEYVAPENDIEAFFANIFAETLGLDKVGVTDNFFEIGGTSLLVTKITMAALNKDYNLNYADVFDNPSPRELANFILSDEDSGATISEEANYDYAKINELLKKNTLENFIKGEKADNLGDILLTGATGFLGIHVLRELLEEEKGNIYCFVRSRKNLSSEDRLKTLLFYYFSNDYNELFGERLHIIEGDITDYKDFEKLISYNIDTVVNCAANVKHFSSGTDIEDINLGGVINGLKFAKLKDAKYVQVSTYSVAGESVDNFPPIDYKYNEGDLFIGQTIDNQYISSKFLAERAILESAVEDGLDVKIMRVGNLMARDSDSEFQINFDSNGFINRLKAFVTIGVMPYSMLSTNVEFSPIDITAKSIVALAKSPKECVVFHPYQHHTICFGDIIDVIRPLDLIIDPVEDDEYEKALDEVLNDKTRQEGVSGLITSVGSGKFKKIWIAVDNNYTIQALYRLGIKWPVISENYVYKFVEFLDDLSFFDI
ncbi:MAG: amino acid adenylation domain-containing protein [Methanobacteriaceae archaeon]|nr:amino acid adenylation domain-containing protein [Methanobacteriaceae archaeon]